METIIETTSSLKQSIPWVEKYRPTNFDDIVLDPVNRKIFKNILDKNYFPNLLFYGPPGTGKTTTIINIINEYQVLYNQKNKGTIIHLNASDERGIDIIRSQIHQFVKSKNFFEAGLKFVILDEVDYMTKNAQQALKYLLQSSCYNVRFCLICNYISKIDESLKNEFICIRFNQLPKNDIYKFIKNITKNENLDLSDAVIDRIQQIYNSDIRSMINFIQLNQNITVWEENIITDEVWENLHTFLSDKHSENKEDWKTKMNSISLRYNMDKKGILKNYFNYIIRKKSDVISEDFLTIAEMIMHSNDTNLHHIFEYFILHMSDNLIKRNLGFLEAP
jgi:replication factor C subunit 3/5